MTYAFILGRVYTLSIAELVATLPALGISWELVAASPEAFIIETPTPLDAERIQKRLGGIIKIIRIVDVVKKREQDSINFTLQNYFKPSKIKAEYLKSGSGKIQFGISIYLLDMQVKAFGDPKRLGMFIKRAMQDSGSSIRLVLPEFNALALASVVVTHNQLTQKGAEICVIADTDRVYVGKTLVVQDFEDYGRRDYQRPTRDDIRGMIPPKVAQTMLNITGAAPNETILDPFCGVGTFIQEGSLLGYKMIGSDIDKLAITGSERNLEWFRNRYKIPKGKYHVDVADATTASQLITHLQEIKAIESVSAVVTEGTLGPIYSKLPSSDEMQRNFAALSKLYTKVFADMAQYLKSKAKVVMCVPAYKVGAQEYALFPSLDFAVANGYNIISLIPLEIASNMPFLRLTPRKTAIYDRKDQIVAREILIFEKQ
ncbi:MAG: hypothetical protein KBD66_00720 [Candidatus Doudnabacteria bacterium]|nr:hypothetical protein [Candidatus Doudnabacteria bacterium]